MRFKKLKSKQKIIHYRHTGVGVPQRLGIFLNRLESFWNSQNSENPEYFL